MDWDLEILKQAVGELYGDDRVSKLTSSLNSIVERQEFSRFYFYESKEALEKVLFDKNDAKSLMKLVFTHGHENREDFDECIFKAKAHIISFVQNLHSVSDILSHVVYYSLNLTQAKNESQISIKQVKGWLKSFVEYGGLGNMIQSLIDHEGFEYLEALVNHSKHRSIVEPFFNINLREQGENMKEMKFRDFTYREKKHPARLVYDFLESEFDRQSELVVNIGNEINRLVQKNLNRRCSVAKSLNISIKENSPRNG